MLYKMLKDKAKARKTTWASFKVNILGITFRFNFHYTILGANYKDQKHHTI